MRKLPYKISITDTTYGDVQCLSLTPRIPGFMTPLASVIFNKISVLKKQYRSSVLPHDHDHKNITF